MSKRAEEKAVEYQIRTHGPNVMGGASMLSEEEYMRFNMNLDFKNGYELAEKDLALTWEDIRTICLLTIGAEVVQDNPDLADNVQEKLEQVFYEDVLRRFREMKNK